tara:strand:- start:21002 stop:23083 length:2082 start_codon:yes stop_codon:yes gene_type:complete
MPACYTRRLSKIATLIATVIPTAAAIAQTTLQETVLVTANRIEESSLTLPLAWSTVDQEALDLTGLVHINQVMQRVPGVWISRNNGQESLIGLRSPVLTGAGGCGAFYTAADGISLRAAGFCNVNQLFDANSEQAGRIEVIKGPATALYGSNAMHGVINILSAAPTAQEDQSVSVEAGPNDYYRARYHYRNTLGRHGLSLNLNGATDGGYQDDSGYDQQKITLRHDYAGDTWNIISVLDMSNLNQETAGYIQGDDAYKDDDLKDTNPNPEAYRDVWSARWYSSASRDIGSASTLTLTPYLRDNEMEFLQHFLPWQPVEKNGHSSAGLRASLQTDAGSLRWTNGIDAEYTDGWLKEVQADEFSPNQLAGVHYDYQVDAIVAAAYSQVRTQGDSPWEASAGVRLEYTDYDYDNQTGDGSACAPQASACRFYRPADRSDDFADWSLNAGISYRFGDDQVVYARAASGFRAPQATELYRLQSGQQNADLDSEQLDSIELGLRGVALNALEYDLSVYHMRKDNVIFQDADRQNISGAQTVHTGLEASIDYRLSEAWKVSLDANMANHEYDNRVRLLGASGDIKGNEIDTAPEFFGSARLQWDMAQLTGRPAISELEWVYMGSYYVEPDNLHEYDGHSVLNLRTSASLGKRWQATLRLTNLLDEDYAERADFGFGQYRYFVGQPRGAYMEVSYQFGDAR